MTSLIQRVAFWRAGQAMSGNNGLILARDVAAHALTGDWTAAARLLVAVETSKADLRAIRLIFGACLEGVTVKVDDKHPEKYVLSPVKGKKWADTRAGNKLAIVEEAINAGYSFRSEALLSQLGRPKPEVAFDCEKYAKSVYAKILKEDGVSLGEFQRALARVAAAELPKDGAVSSMVTVPAGQIVVTGATLADKIGVSATV